MTDQALLSYNDNRITIISHNMHGFNQGISFLDSMCSSNVELIFLQETWLTVDSMLKSVECFNDYNVFCSSAMDDNLSSGILKGRPFGGLCILFNKSLFNKFNKVECLVADKNFIILKADQLLLVNVYFPSVQSSFDYDNLVVLLDNIIDICAGVVHKDIIIAGDHNCNVLSNSKVSLLINSKFNSINTVHSYNFLNEKFGKLFTFCVPNRNSYSLIDFFFLSKDLGKKAKSYEIVDHVANFSDHLPIKISFDFPDLYDWFSPNPFIPKAGNVCCSENLSNKITFDWNTSNKALYYECTRLHFFELHKLFSSFSLHELKSARPDLFSSHGANTIYKNFTIGLINCSLQCFDVKKPGSKSKLK